MKMVTKCVNPWLQQRQTILTSLNNLAGLLPKDLCKKPVVLTGFFQSLIDYICAGHLQIFSLVVERYAKQYATTKEILEKIEQNTDFMIKYNYKFNRLKNVSAYDIISLLEQFINRIELEDLLLKTHEEHSNEIDLPLDQNLLN